MSAVNKKQDGAAVQQPAPVVAHPNNLPVMSAQPKDYAPLVRVDEGAIPRRITPIRQLRREGGLEPEWVDCPFCKQTTTIRRVAEPSDEAKCCLLCCGLPGLIFLCIPRSGEWCENIDIHCASCDKHIATITPDDEIKLARVSNRPPLPTQKKQPATSPAQKKGVAVLIPPQPPALRSSVSLLQSLQYPKKRRSSNAPQIKASRELFLPRPTDSKCLGLTSDELLLRETWAFGYSMEVVKCDLPRNLYKATSSSNHNVTSSSVELRDPISRHREGHKANLTESTTLPMVQ
ncbi:hypothetical protein CIB48_g2053 [Xylaria polymorpha]|nr:hypothetical protein CIB48_g2053 [Xylaria polymorpha]